jgi:hypothetical protein
MPQPHYPEKYTPSPKTNRKHSKNSSRNTFRKVIYAHPKAPMPPPSSSLKRKMDDYDQSKTIDS